MHQFGLNLEQATEWAVRYHERVEARFLDGLKRIPSWGKDIDEQVAEYVHRAFGNWPRASDCWNFESGRYFGSKGLEYQQTRHVPMLPKIQQKTDLHRENVVIVIVDEL